MTKKNFDEKFAAMVVYDLADKMADNFKPLVDGDKALFDVSKRDNALNVFVNIENVNNVDYRKEMSFERFAYSRERYIRTYLPKAIRHAVSEYFGVSVKVKISTKNDLWSLSSLDEASNGLRYDVELTPIEAAEKPKKEKEPKAEEKVEAHTDDAKADTAALTDVVAA